MKTPKIAAMAVAAVLAAGFVSVPAHAELLTECVGEGGDVTVPGDVVVPKGRSCELNGTTVKGDVRVARNANLVMSDVSIDGGLNVAKHAYADADATTVAGRVTLNRAFGMLTNATTMKADVVTRAPDSHQGFVDLTGSTIAGTLRSTTGDLVLRQADIGKNLVANGAYFTEMHDTFIDGKARVIGNKRPVVFCGGAIGGKATFKGNEKDVRLGVVTTPLGCTSPTYWGDTVRIRNTRGTVQVDKIVVNGDLVMRDNDSSARLGTRHVVRGKTVGDYTNVDLTPSAAKQSRRAAPQESNRSSRIKDKAKKRRDDAHEQARKSGAAHLG